MRIKPHHVLVWAVCAIAALDTARAQTGTETAIYSFGYFPRGLDPYSSLARDAEGNFYSTTYEGGHANMGVVFKLGASAQQTVLHSFTGGKDGGNPYAGVLVASNGDLYGTTYRGGASNAGVVYKITQAGQFEVLYTFTGGADGGYPYSGLIADSSGNLYGTASTGGASNLGVVYKLAPSGLETVLYSFKGGTDGANPRGGVIFGASGNLYGTTYSGGSYLEGIVFKLDAAGAETVLCTFVPGTGGDPSGGLVQDSAGNFYGTASTVVFKLTPTGQYTELAFLGPEAGGYATAGVVLDSEGNLYGATDPPTSGGENGSPHGAVFKVDAAGKLTVLYRFVQTKDTGEGTGPNGGVVLDSAGSIYGSTPYIGPGGAVYSLNAANEETTLYGFPGAPGGTTPYGGLTLDSAGYLYGTAGWGGQWNAGAVFRIDPQGQETALYQFRGGDDGAKPEAPVVLDSAGNIYGTTIEGGTAGQGVVFKIDTSGNETVLHSFTGGADGGLPNGVIVDADGNLYGTTLAGGDGSVTGEQEGVVFEMDPQGNETVLHAFTGLSDGGLPTAGVIRDSAGNLYGTTNEGGSSGGGVVYQVAPSGDETVLYTFERDTGYAPIGGVVFGPDGSLYGAASGGGTTGDGEGAGDGAVFRLSVGGSYQALYTFTGGADGGAPLGVVRDAAGNLYGTTSWGGNTTDCAVPGCGVVFQVSSGGKETVLCSFSGGAGGYGPVSGVIIGASGNLIGATPLGGSGIGTPVYSGGEFGGAGVVYSVTVH